MPRPPIAIGASQRTCLPAASAARVRVLCMYGQVPMTTCGEVHSGSARTFGQVYHSNMGAPAKLLGQLDAQGSGPSGQPCEFQRESALTASTSEAMISRQSAATVAIPNSSAACSAKGIRLAQAVQVGPRIPVRMQLSE